MIKLGLLQMVVVVGGGGIIRPIGLVWPGIRPDYRVGFGLARSFAPNENLNLAKRS